MARRRRGNGGGGWHSSSPSPSYLSCSRSVSSCPVPRVPRRVPWSAPAARRRVSPLVRSLHFYLSRHPRNPRFALLFSLLVVVIRSENSAGRARGPSVSAPVRCPSPVASCSTTASQIPVRRGPPLRPPVPRLLTPCARIPPCRCLALSLLDPGPASSSTCPCMSGRSGHAAATPGLPLPSRAPPPSPRTRRLPASACRAVTPPVLLPAVCRFHPFSPACPTASAPPWLPRSRPAPRGVGPS